MNRRQFLSTAAAIPGLSLAAPRLASAQTAARVLKFVPSSDLTTLDPMFTTGFVTRNHALMVYDTLYGADENQRAQPQMAEGHTIGDDGKTWRITLREGLRFHDGEPVRARDVVQSLKRWASRDPYGMTLMERTEELLAESDRVVVFRLKKPFPHLADVLGKPTPYLPAIMPERLAKTSGSTQISEIVGSGPYQFVPEERTSGALAVYRRFEGYVPRPNGKTSFMAGPKVAHFDRVEWHTMPDAGTAASALQMGEIDWWEHPSPDLLPLLERNRNLKSEILQADGSMGVMRFNHLQPPFNNPELRRALLAGIVQSDYMISVAGDDTKKWRDGVGFFQPDSAMASKDGLEALTGPRSNAAVKKALEKAGYNGERVVMLSAADSSLTFPLNEVGAAYLRDVGINLDYQTQDWGSVWQRLQSRESIDKGGWNIHCNYTAGLSAMNPAAFSYLRGNGAGALFGWPSSPAIEGLRDQWLDSGNLAEQQRICRDIQLKAFEELPFIPLGVFYQGTAYRKDLVDMQKGLPLFYGVRRV
ncbi:MAG: transporter substrate-binding protein [Roseomonas sp.]|jgi:peptide/nickel transport system substrate-binding protein|nr:transporter substrate-binding protein [Roseomonas sp.]